jgi:hypothetical protein
MRIILATGLAALLLAGCEKGAEAALPPDQISAEEADAAEPCAAEDLELVLEGHDKTSGVQSWAFVNRGQATCSLTGRPSLFYGTFEKQLPIVVRSDGATPRRALLRPGGKAGFTLTYPGEEKNCRGYSRMQIDPPGDRSRPWVFSPAPEICGFEVHVSVVRGKVASR